MAGDWIKMRAALVTDCKVAAMARYLEFDRDFQNWFVGDARISCNETVTEVCNARVTVSVTVCGLLTVWSSINAAIKADDIVPNLQLIDIDVVAGIPSFGAAMASVGWAVEDESGGLVFPNFSDNNVPERQRSLTNAERQQNFRRRKKAQIELEETVTNRNESNDNKRREEKNKEESNTTTNSDPPSPVTADWVVVVAELISFGIQETDGPIQTAKDRKISPQFILELIAFAKFSSPRWGPGALRRRILNAIPGQDAKDETLWMPDTKGGANAGELLAQESTFLKSLTKPQLKRLAEWCQSEGDMATYRRCEAEGVIDCTVKPLMRAYRMITAKQKSEERR